MEAILELSASPLTVPAETLVMALDLLGFGSVEGADVLGGDAGRLVTGIERVGLDMESAGGCQEIGYSDIGLGSIKTVERVEQGGGDILTGWGG